MTERPSKGPYIELSTLSKHQVPQAGSNYLGFNEGEIKQSTIKHKDVEYQLIPVEIEKESEIGLVIGQIDGEQWVFIDEILPNGMIDTHGVLNEGDYLLQTGSYSLIGIDVTVALVLIERAFEQNKKTISFIAARQIKSSVNKELPKPILRKNHSTKQERTRSQVSFIDYENLVEDDDDDDVNESTNTKL